MATDLFSKYYDNPSKSYLYTNMTCNGQSADEISFDISGSDGVISDNENALSKIDLSDIHVPLTEYTNEMRTINPYSFIYVKGITYGKSYMTKSYGPVTKTISEDEKWIESYSIRFLIERKKSDGITSVEDINVAPTEDKNSIELIQEKFELLEIPVTVALENPYITFTSTQEGYEFWIRAIEIDDEAIPEYEGGDSEWTNAMDSSYVENYALKLDSSSCIIFESDYKFVPATKYSNGAMKGCVVIIDYPEYNNSEISEYAHSIKMAHIRNRVEDYIPIKDSSTSMTQYIRLFKDVVDTFYSRYEVDMFEDWSNETLTLDDNSVYERMATSNMGLWDYSSIPSCMELFNPRNTKFPDSMGLYGYLNYVGEKGLWNSIGQFYARTTISDNPSENTSNLIPSFILYNPNSFPVVAKYMTFV